LPAACETIRPPEEFPGLGCQQGGAVRRFITVLAIVPLPLGVMAGCGSDSSNKSSAATVDLEADNYYFKPTDITLTAGKAATIVVKNEGTVEHNLTAEGIGVKQDVQPGKSEKVSVTPAAGTYPFHCEYHPTQMMGTITAR
jgi:plastocyanin